MSNNQFNLNLPDFTKNKRNRKAENIELLEWLLKEFQSNPHLEDVRLGQLLINSTPSESILYNIEAPALKENIELSLKY